MGYFWVDNSFLTFLGHFGHVWYPYPCPKWLDFSPIPAQAVIPNLRPILLCNTTNMGYFWVDNSFLTFLGHFGNVLYPYPCPKWLDFSPVPAQAVIPNLRPILLCNTTNMGDFWVRMPIKPLLNYFRHVSYTCPKWLYFSPIPAQAKIPNLRPIFLCNDFDFFLS